MSGSPKPLQAQPSVTQDRLPEVHACAYCRVVVPGPPRFCIYRDGYRDGPEVPLCAHCYGPEGPSCHQIWKKISLNNRTALDPSLN